MNRQNHSNMIQGNSRRDICRSIFKSQFNIKKINDVIINLAIKTFENDTYKYKYVTYIQS